MDDCSRQPTGPKNRPVPLLNAHRPKTESAATSQARFPVFGRFVLNSSLPKIDREASKRAGGTFYTSLPHGGPLL